ncbi:hypothetical protein E1286_19265 [Nonomuraea terrae]|uniref:Uncharacterized protein n=1 Tax=Nonomuraea terrae TaxID=2530383 RepID=A0A4R4YRK6_9ACTN|nr:hypothetical protein [Nonomuraea terrae]TDD46974.1 hypothetical protein E1286_19265 [Nonomuraea terrae]
MPLDPQIRAMPGRAAPLSGLPPGVVRDGFRVRGLLHRSRVSRSADRAGEKFVGAVRAARGVVAEMTA